MVGQGMADNPMNLLLVPSPIPVEISLVEIVVFTRSGHLELKNTDPDDNPSVNFNYFKEPDHLNKCVEGMKTLISVVASEAFSKFRFREVSVQALINLIVKLPVNLRPRHVLGVDALRVIDGSTFRGSPGANPQATVMMLGRYMGNRILHDRFS
ncbi:hypothetical protein TIFTF001_013870 [Ficus carica]|uniref:Glucose-methanol-choline oxidoreductase C-terminal domain-containing protein n=1 Tax=Ficus carica TaxID=3494 RepID=A0AA87ZVS8_FICCA|nr:hypothetical protein TIFTF001_013870 [Ficus carica]